MHLDDGAEETRDSCGSLCDIDECVWSRIVFVIQEIEELYYANGER